MTVFSYKNARTSKLRTELNSTDLWLDLQLEPSDILDLWLSYQKWAWLVTLVDTRLLGPFDSWLDVNDSSTTITYCSNWAYAFLGSCENRHRWLVQPCRSVKWVRHDTSLSGKIKTFIRLPFMFFCWFRLYSQRINRHSTFRPTPANIAYPTPRVFIQCVMWFINKLRFTWTSIQLAEMSVHRSNCNLTNYFDSNIQ